jgi:filamentous hemagglutinin
MKDAAESGETLTSQQFQMRLQNHLSHAKAVGQLGADTMALLTNQNVNTAIGTAQTATENNFIPMAIGIGLGVYEGYQLYTIHQKQGAEAALKHLAKTAAFTFVGVTVIKGGFKIGQKVFASSQAAAAWEYVLAQYPVLASTLESAGSALSALASKGKTLDARLDAGVSKGLEKLGLKGSAKTNITLGEGKTSTKNVVNKDKLKSQLISEQISKGHAFEKHVLHQGEFPQWIRTKSQLRNHIEKVMSDKNSITKKLSQSRTAYVHESTGTVVIHNPKAIDGGTVFQPESLKEYMKVLGIKK